MIFEQPEALTIGDLIARNGGSIKTGPFGTALKASEYSTEGVPLISVREIGHGSFHIDAKTPRVSPDTVARLPEYLLLEGDIVFARKGGIERCALVTKKEAGWFLGSDGIRVRPPKSCDARFLAASLQTRSVKDWLVQNSTGSTMASLNQATIARLPIALPSIGRQEAVAELLGTLDDRITLLRETNATLEAIAQALFKSWFVDFDPVRAKMEGRAPEGMDEATAALFPDCFEESELGLAPRGWDCGTLADVAMTTRNQIHPEAMTAEQLYVGLEHIPRRSLALEVWGTAGELASAKACFSKGNILFGKLRPYFHKVVIAPFSGVCSTDILVCKAMVDEYYSFVALQLSSVEFVAYADRLSNGAKMPRVNWKDLAAYGIVIPPSNVAAAFGEAVLPLFDKIIASVLEAKTLSALRDTLLPRLISGQLRLPDANEAASDLLTGT
jgi:type I restriction enzyme S subunit